MAATGVTSVLGVIGGLVALGTGAIHQPGLLSVAGWTTLVALLGSCSILLMSKLWERKEEDKPVFRFKQLTMGLLVGLIAFGIGQFLMVPWDAVSGPNSFIHQAPKEADISISFGDEDIEFNARHWQGFYDANGKPLLRHSYPTLHSSSVDCDGGGKVICFAQNRFSYGSVFMAVLMAHRPVADSVPTTLGHDHRGSMPSPSIVGALVDSSDRRPDPTNCSQIT